ncbi:MAG: hypothetical protein K2F77_05335, partial [Muribaculaceae bacterium]|nr:hypothetical protein [Muribaculaceae bacterium]
EQDSNLHVSQHSHLKRARLPFRHLGKVAFATAKLCIFIESAKKNVIFMFLFCGTLSVADSVPICKLLKIAA